MAKEILDNLVPEHIKVVVGKKSYSIGGLSIKQTMQLIKEIMRVIVRLGDADLTKLQSGETNVEDLLVFFDFLNEDEVAKVIGIMLNEDDGLFLKKNLTLESITEILAAVCEKNNIEKILKNVQRMVKTIKQQRKTSSPSLPG